MKKSLKILTVLAVVIMMVACFSVNVFAVSVDNVIGSMENNQNANTSKVSEVGGKLMDIISTVGIVAAVIILMILGIKYMTGSASEKAEYKKTMIPYVVGLVILLAAAAIVKMVAQFGASI